MKKRLLPIIVFLIVCLVMGFYVPAIRADLTFGKTDIGGSHSGAADDRIYVCKFTLTEDGDITKISWYGYAESGSVDMTCAIYDDDGEPNNLKGVSVEVAVNTTPQWWNFTFDPVISLTADDYWLGWNQGGAQDVEYYWDVESGVARYGNDEYDDGFPNPAPSMTNLDKEISIFATYTTEEGEAYTADLSQSVSTTWNVLTEWDAIADVSQSITTSWSVLNEWDAILDVTQALTTSWNVLTNLNTFVDLSQTITSTWVILTQWNAILDLTQSLTTNWTVLTQTNFNIIASLSNTFTWLVDVIHTIGGIAYIADLSQAISTTWMILTQSTFNVNLAQSLTTTWNVLIESSFNIITSLSNTFTWTVDVLKGVVTDDIVDLSLAVVTSWIVDVARTPWTTIYATKGFVLATIMLLLLIGLPILGIIILRKKG